MDENWILLLQQGHQILKGNFQAKVSNLAGSHIKIFNNKDDLFQNSPSNLINQLDIISNINQILDIPLIEKIFV